jgi:hypothetical protein
VCPGGEASDSVRWMLDPRLSVMRGPQLGGIRRRPLSIRCASQGKEELQPRYGTHAAYRSPPHGCCTETTPAPQRATRLGDTLWETRCVPRARINARAHFTFPAVLHACSCVLLSTHRAAPHALPRRCPIALFMPMLITNCVHPHSLLSRGDSRRGAAMATAPQAERGPASF